MSDQEYMDFIHSHSIYLWTIGNAAVDSSYQHILSYMNTTDTPLLWKRAAVHSISRYKSPQVKEIVDIPDPPPPSLNYMHTSK